MRNLIKKLCVFALASIGLATSAVAGDAQTRAIGDPTQFSQCTLGEFPSGYTCSPAVSLGQVFTIESLNNVASNLGCSKIAGFNALSCPIGGTLPGLVVFYTYDGTQDVSRIVYIAIPR